MKQTLRKWLSALLAVCMLISVTSLSAFAATNGYADLSDDTMLVGSSITVIFSGTASDTEYYNVQIVQDDNWDDKLVNEYITSGNSYTISGYSAGTYQIYVGYYENGSWKSDALSTTFTVTEETPGYVLSLSIRETNPSLGDTVDVSTVITADGTVYDIPDGCALSIWYLNDNDWVTPVNGSSTTTSTEIYLSADNFTAGETYTVQAALYDSSWNELVSDSVSFTVGGSTSSTPTYGLTLTADTSTPALGDSVTVTASFTVDGTEQDTIPTGILSIWYGYDNDGWVPL